MWTSWAHLWSSTACKRHPIRSSPSVQTQPESIIAWKLIVFIFTVSNEARDSQVSLLHGSLHYAAGWRMVQLDLYWIQERRLLIAHMFEDDTILKLTLFTLSSAVFSVAEARILFEERCHSNKDINSLFIHLSHIPQCKKLQNRCFQLD